MSFFHEFPVMRERVTELTSTSLPNNLIMIIVGYYIDMRAVLRMRKMLDGITMSTNSDDTSENGSGAIQCHDSCWWIDVTIRKKWRMYQPATVIICIEDIDGHTNLAEAHLHIGIETLWELMGQDEVKLPWISVDREFRARLASYLLPHLERNWAIAECARVCAERLRKQAN